MHCSGKTIRTRRCLKIPNPNLTHCPQNITNLTSFNIIVIITITLTPTLRVESLTHRGGISLLKLRQKTATAI